MGNKEEHEVSFAIDAKLVRLGSYLVSKHVGISSDEADKLQTYVDAWKDERGLSEAEAWSLIISVEAWAQARKAFWVAIGIGLLSILVAIGIGLLSVAAQVITWSGG